MDRRHRPFLNLLLPLLLVGGLTLAGTLSAQDATPAATATPWVQASPPPAVAPKPPAATPAAPSANEVAWQMMLRRQAEEQRAQTPDKSEKSDKADKATKPKDEKKGAARLDHVPPDERAAYQRNLPLWKQLPEEERDLLRQRADERAKQETDKAYQESNLNLDHDQREIFDLRYRQERRRVERELQEKANAERARRLAEVSDRLKREFGNKSSPQGADTPAPKKAPAPTPAPAPANPDATPTPGFMR